MADATGLEWVEKQINGETFWVTETDAYSSSAQEHLGEFSWEMWCNVSANRIDGGDAPTLEAAKAAVEAVIAERSRA